MKLNFLIFLTGLFLSFNSYAFKFSPMSTGISVSDGKNASLFFLENDSEQPIAIQLNLAKREISEDGVESNLKIDKELTLYPSQLIIPPNEKRSVKVTWVGKIKPTKELAYRLIAEQLPIDLEKDKKKKTSIKVLLRYVAALYVAGDEFSSDVELESFEVDSKNIIFKMKNKGKKHQVLSSLNLTITGTTENKKEIFFSPEDLKGMTGENILAETSRIFRLEKVGKFQGVSSSDKVKISFDKD